MMIIDNTAKSSLKLVVDDILDRHCDDGDDGNSNSNTVVIPLAQYLQYFYGIYNIEYLKDAWMIADKYDNRRSELWLKLIRKYGLTPIEGVKLLRNIYHCDDRDDDALITVFNVCNNDDEWMINDGMILTNSMMTYDGNTNEDDRAAIMVRANLWRYLLFHTNNNNGLGLSKEGMMMMIQDMCKPSYRKISYTNVLHHHQQQQHQHQQYINSNTISDDDEDDELIIRRDLKRTMRDIPFFNDITSNHHDDVMERILLLFTATTGVKYVQGMNQVCALLYYVLRDEGDTFWAFRKIIDNITSIYIPHKDHTQDGIYCKVKEIERLLNKYDPILYRHIIEVMNIPLITIAIRWLTTLFTLDIPNMGDVMKIWDIIILSNRYNKLSYYLLCLSTAYIITNPVRNDLLCSNDSNTCLQLLSQCIGKNKYCYSSSYCYPIDDLIWTSLGIMAIEEKKVGEACSGNNNKE